MLTPEQKKRGAVAASAGNHALGMAYHGQLLGIPITLVMPVGAYHRWRKIITNACRCKRPADVNVRQMYLLGRPHHTALDESRRESPFFNTNNRSLRR